jgi:predicted transcriptional regulator
MKTTIELSDPLFNAAKQLAQQSQTTLRALMEEGLRHVLAEGDRYFKRPFCVRCRRFIARTAHLI